MRRHRAIAPLASPLLVLALLGAGVAHAAVSPWAEHEVVATRLLALGPGADGALRLGLHVRLDPGWHVYWKHGGDAGLPPEVVLRAGDAPLGPAPVLFPAPRRYDLRGGLVALGYDGEVVYPLRAPPLAGPPGSLTAAVDYLACAEECIPFHDELTVDLAAPAGEETTLLATWEARLPVPAERVPDLRATASYLGGADGGDLRFALTRAGRDRGALELFVAPMPGVVVGVPRRERGEGDAERFAIALRPQSTGAMPPRLDVEWTATGVNGAGAAAAVEGTLALAVGPARSTGASPPDGGGFSDGSAAVAPRLPALKLLLRGLALALSPSSLALLLLVRAAGGRRTALAALAAATTLVAALVAGEAFGRLASVAVPLAEPAVVGALALPHLALALALWWRGERVVALARRWWVALLPPLLALPYVPAWVGPTGAWGSREHTALAAGFAALVAVAAARRPTRAVGATTAGWLPSLGFLPLLTLLWISWRLASALPPARLAGLQLGWLLVALGAFLALGGGRLGRWLGGALATAAALAAHLWVLR